MKKSGENGKEGTEGIEMEVQFEWGVPAQAVPATMFVEAGSPRGHKLVLLDPLG